MSKTDIVKREPLRAVFENPESIKQDIATFRKAIVSVLDQENDIVLIQGKPFIKKSGWNALNLYFGINTKVISSNRTDIGNDEFAWSVVVEAEKSGYSVQRSASCTSVEQHKKHPNNPNYERIEADCYAMAETRAIGRASAALFGVGDVSAEELGELNKTQAKTGTVPKKEPKPADVVEWCSCQEKKPKFEKNSKGLHECYDCKKPVDPDTAKMLLEKGKQ